jgi:hypothetical protein
MLDETVKGDRRPYLFGVHIDIVTGRPRATVSTCDPSKSNPFFLPLGRARVPTDPRLAQKQSPGSSRPRSPRCPISARGCSRAAAVASRPVRDRRSACRRRSAQHGRASSHPSAQSPGCRNFGSPRRAHGLRHASQLADHPVPGRRSLTNVVSIVSREWTTRLVETITSPISGLEEVGVGSSGRGRLPVPAPLPSSRVAAHPGGQVAPALKGA